MERQLVQVIASAFQAMVNCEQSKNHEWLARWRDSIAVLCKNYMPSGSGVDAGTQFDFRTSKTEKLVFLTAFHHMNESGMYDGWTEHKVTVTPSLLHGFVLHVSGRDRDGIKDYLSELFRQALSSVGDFQVTEKSETIFIG